MTNLPNLCTLSTRVKRRMSLFGRPKPPVHSLTGTPSTISAGDVPSPTTAVASPERSPVLPTRPLSADIALGALVAFTNDCTEVAARPLSPVSSASLFSRSSTSSQRGRRSKPKDKTTRRQRKFRRTFCDLDSAIIRSMYASFKCALDLDVFWKGVLYVTPHGIYFHGRRMNPFIRFNYALYHANLATENQHHSGQQCDSQAANTHGTDRSVASHQPPTHFPFNVPLPTKYPETVNIALSFGTVQSIHKESLMGILPNVIRIKSSNRSYIFTAFYTRDNAYDTLAAARDRYLHPDPPATASPQPTSVQTSPALSAASSSVAATTPAVQGLTAHMLTPSATPPLE
ncbi:hypothetical protein IWQ60_009132, partial [Tieghemiomyces parasiticus]